MRNGNGWRKGLAGSRAGDCESRESWGVLSKAPQSQSVESSPSSPSSRSRRVRCAALRCVAADAVCAESQSVQCAFALEAASSGPAASANCRPLLCTAEMHSECSSFAAEVFWPHVRIGRAAAKRGRLSRPAPSARGAARHRPEPCTIRTIRYACLLAVGELSSLRALELWLLLLLPAALFHAFYWPQCTASAGVLLVRRFECAAAPSVQPAGIPSLSACRFAVF